VAPKSATNLASKVWVKFLVFWCIFAPWLQVSFGAILTLIARDESVILHASLALPTYSALSSVYETVHVRSSVCPSRKPTAAGLLQWARRAGNINRLLQQQRAHAGSATL